MSLVNRAVSGARTTSAARPPDAGATRLSQTVQADQGQVSGVRQEMTFIAELPELFVHLSVTEWDGGVAGVPVAPGGGLRAGARYHVTAATSLNRHVAAAGARSGCVVQTGVRAGRPLLPLPEASAGLEVVLPEGEAMPLTRSEWEAWTYEFEFAVAQEVEEETVHLGLALREKGTPVDHPAARLSFAVQEGRPRAPRAMRRWLPLGSRPPAGTAFIHVVPHDDEWLRISGWAAEAAAPALNDESIRRPKLKTHGDGAVYRQALLEAMNDFAAGAGGALSKWLVSVLEACGDDCCIVVVDQDAAQVPWEMVKPSGKGTLGTRARVVRWADLHYRDVTLELPLDEVTYAGRVAALLDGGDRPGWAAEYLGEDAWVECDDLVSSLLDRPGPVGVVYLSSRGLFVHGDEDDDDLALLPNPHGTRRLRFDDLEDALEPRPLVFADAPFSGRLLFCGGRACGMARAAMQRLAAGFVGTLGPVDRDYALETARVFLERALSEDGVCPAELLRELRVSAAREWLAARSGAERNAAKRRMLNASMFVFYGGPRVRVRILRLAGGGDA